MKKPTKEQIQAALSDIASSESLLIQQAASLVLNDGMPSAYAADHDRHVPKWILRIFTQIQETGRYRAQKIKDACDKINKSRALLTQALEQKPVDVDPKMLRKPIDDGHHIMYVNGWNGCVDHIASRYDLVEKTK